MRSSILFFTLFIGAVTSAGGETTQPKADEKLSYAIGVLFGRNMALDVDVSTDAFLQGVRDVLTDSKLKYTPEEMQQVVTAFREQQMKAQQDVGQKNAAAGQAYLDANAQKEGVTRLPSGLQYQILKTGSGPKPKSTDSVVVHYRGTLIDGTEFDSSYSRGEPTPLRLDGVIKGWQEAVSLMPVGSMWKIFVPPALGYGERGAGRSIGPNATLIFEIELLEIKAQ
ncbi:MAG: FKBP-type peptidyl-prolyl cis-trans isomerase [Gammaproteobacteria bacterium]|nr:FKBP-type peptidyl-prolyl cis-trans isomerase [Gammaproteobacteria bacterium]